ncbi:T9SS type A sorting domain-containing protein [Salibacteraceae bacterium]|nr:T9SS type A sorting domain-containing protein [Salibacteraceae bacterium]MDB4104278.1 T9SS type A sorting domain-containing protein [Salibacteraceae bacterium]MDB9710325.1 T9SS type A sorting domain-containing protein [Salibacteraceae bacterium]
MNKIKRIFFFLVTGVLVHISHISFAQIEPQFKFYLAFEDAKNEKDTVWYGIDESADLMQIDSIFGDTNTVFDTTSFQVFYWTNDTVVSKTIVSGTDEPEWSAFISASKFELPIVMRWDTNLLLSNDLPIEIRRAWAQSNYFNEFIAGPLDFFEDGSVNLDPFMEGGGTGQHFPLTFKFSEIPLNWIGIQQVHSSDNFIIQGNPILNELKIEANRPLLTEYYILNSFGQRVNEGSISQLSTTIDVSHHPSGNYYLIINSDSGTHEIHPFIKR